MIILAAVPPPHKGTISRVERYSGTEDRAMTDVENAFFEGTPLTPAVWELAGAVCLRPESRWGDT